jgi:hypothetical protein
MRYFCLIYDDETRRAASPEKEADAATAGYVERLTEPSEETQS